MAVPIVAAVPQIVKGVEWALTAYSVYTAAKEVPVIVERTEAVIDGDKEQIAPLVIDTAILGVSSYFGAKGISSIVKTVKVSGLTANATAKTLTEPIRNKSVDKVAELGIAKEVNIPGVSKATFGRMTENLSPKAIEIFKKDVIDNPALAKLFAKEPNAIKCYENAIGSKLRTDITFLRYTSKNADKFFGKGFKESGKDLIFKDVKDVTKITDTSGNYLGKIIGKNENGGLTIDISKAERNTLTNLYPMSNAKYIDGNKYVITDKFGRPIEYRVQIDKNVQAAGRQFDISHAKNVKKYYGVNGEQVAKFAQNDEGGHMIADSYGGSSDAINIMPQNSSINRGGIWRSSEQLGLDVAREGNQVERIIKLKYPDKNSLRPSEFILEQKVNGAYDVKGGVSPQTIKNILE